MEVVNPAFGVSALNSSSGCGCICTQMTTDPYYMHDNMNDIGVADGNCHASCNTSVEFNLDINLSNAVAKA